MALGKDSLIIGLTGSFGSGCTTLKECIERMGFETYSLSQPIREEWNKRKSQDSGRYRFNNPLRKELQDIGNELREKNTNDYFANLAIEWGKHQKGDRFVFDGFRNIDEIERFHKDYNKFFLVSLSCSPTERWRRVEINEYRSYGLDKSQFNEDDERDSDEDLPHGQQVARCVDNSDVAIVNENHKDLITMAKDNLEKKIQPYIDLFSQKGLTRHPTERETLMSAAYSIASASYCMKRQVGTIITDDKGMIVATGYNHNPQTLSPCSEDGVCHREVYKKKYFEKLKKINCPSCENDVQKLPYPYKCPSCSENLVKVYIPDRAIGRCRALHAEERAIISSSNRNLNGCVLYTTTFPCLTCAQKIVYAGIKTVVYCEAYPDPEAISLLHESDIEVEEFEGVKARGYQKLFGNWRIRVEENMNKKLLG